MSEELDPIASVPEEGHLADVAHEDVTSSVDSESVQTSPERAAFTKKKSWPLVVGAAALVLGGIGGYSLASSTTPSMNPASFMNFDGHGDKQRGPGQNMPGQNGPGQHGFGDDNQNGLPGMNNQGGQNGPGMMGPHCENTAGDHKAVNADGSCPTGYTLDDKGGMGMPGANGKAPMPGMNGGQGAPGQGVDPDGDNWTGKNKQLAPNSPNPTASKSAVTN